MMSERIMAVVKWFDFDRGFGFLIDPDGESYFLHKNNIIEGNTVLISKGDQISFTQARNEKGFYAIDAKIL
jgi:cold shock protein